MFLPLAHVLARVAQTVVIDVGGTLVYWRGDPARIARGDRARRSPRTSWRCRASTRRCTRRPQRRREPRRRSRALLFAWALEVGRRARSAERAGRSLGPLVGRAAARSPTALGLAKVRALFGPRLKLALVGAAPIDHELLEFFDACGVLVLEGYGMTESCAAATLNPPARAALRDGRAARCPTAR